jgi:hypothetical protein
MTQGTKTLLKTAAALALLGGLVVYSYYGVKKPLEEKIESEAQEKKPFQDFDDKTARAIELSALGVQTRLERADDKADWRIVKPLDAPADQSNVATILRAFKEFESDRAAESEAPDFKKYGLASPHVLLKVSGATGTAGQIALGDKFEFDQTLFARIGDENTVRIVKDAYLSRIEKDAFYFRFKELINFKNEEVQTITLWKDGVTTKIKQDQGDWRVTEPRDWPADKETVEKLLRIAKTRASEFVLDSGVDLDQPTLQGYGLANPAAKIGVDLGAKGFSAILIGKQFSPKDQEAKALGKETGKEKEKVYAMRAGSRAVALWPESAFTDLEKLNVEEFRDKIVASVKDREKVAKIKVQSPDSSYVLVKKQLVKKDEAPEEDEGKKPDKDKNEWVVESPDYGPAKNYKVSSLIYSITHLRSKIAQDTPNLQSLGLDPPLAVVMLYDDEDHLLGSLQFGIPEGERRWVKNPQKPWADSVPEKEYKDIFKNPTDFAENPPKQGEQTAPATPTGQSG